MNIHLNFQINTVKLKKILFFSIPSKVLKVIYVLVNCKIKTINIPLN